MSELQQEVTEEFVYTPNPNIKLVLNGGRSELDSATVPIEWHFSDELIAKKPRYIVICDHEAPLERFRTNESLAWNVGYRYCFAVTEFAGYIQMHRPGRHHFIVMVLYGDKKLAQEKATDYLKRSLIDDRLYAWGIFFNEIVKGEDEYLTYFTAVEFDVPRELFAGKGETAIGKFIFEWVNGWYSRKPVDQCAYRKRLFLAPLFVTLYITMGVAGTFYTLLGAFILLFFGIRPVPILENTKEAWNPSGTFRFNLARFRGYKDWRRQYWRLWRIEKAAKKRNTNDTYLPVWAVPIILLSFIAGGTTAVWFISQYVAEIIALAMLAAMSGLILAAVKIKMKIFKDERYIQRRREKEQKQKETERLMMQRAEDKKRRAQLEFDEAYLACLKQNLSLRAVPQKVNLKTILPKVDRVTRFRLSFWALKAKVCKPFGW